MSFSPEVVKMHVLRIVLQDPWYFGSIPRSHGALYRELFRGIFSPAQLNYLQYYCRAAIADMTRRFGVHIYITPSCLRAIGKLVRIQVTQWAVQNLKLFQEVQYGGSQTHATYESCLEAVIVCRQIFSKILARHTSIIS